MKLQNKINIKVGDKEYRRWCINLSNKEIDKLQWIKGQELESKIIGKKLVLTPVKKKHN